MSRRTEGKELLTVSHLEIGDLRVVHVADLEFGLARYGNCQRTWPSGIGSFQQRKPVINNIRANPLELKVVFSRNAHDDQQKVRDVA